MLLLASLVAGPAAAQQSSPDADEPPPYSVLGKLGLDVESPDGNHALHVWFRTQLRFSTPFNADPRTPDEFEAPSQTSFDVQRIRIRLEGHAYRPWLKYAFEYDFKSDLLDIQLTLARYRSFQLRVGQWKANYNRERVASSGEQQLVDRSIVNREFTVDRQPGVMVFGHLFEGSLGDSWYYVGAFSGNGANASNDDARLMWLARYQWNFLGRDLPFSQSDVEYHEKPAGSLALAAVDNRSPYTRFSTQGGGQLDGFETGGPGRYDLRQYLQEFAFKYRGFSFQQEWHAKEIDDNDTGVVTRLRGAYAAAGFLPWAAWKAFPRPLEFALRWAFVDPDRSVSDDDRTEWTFGANWFFSGHDNKLTADVSWLALEQPGAPTLRDTRFRFQWDVSF